MNRYPLDAMKMNQTIGCGNTDIPMASIVKGRMIETRSCLWRILTPWRIRWILLMPIIALGFRLKALINLDFHLLDMEAYKERPLSPVILIKALPVLLWREINSDAVSRCFKVWILLRQDTVLGMFHAFFLIGARSFHIQRARIYQTGIFLIDLYWSIREPFSNTWVYSWPGRYFHL